MNIEPLPKEESIPYMSPDKIAEIWLALHKKQENAVGAMTVQDVLSPNERSLYETLSRVIEVVAKMPLFVTISKQPE